MCRSSLRSWTVDGLPLLLVRRFFASSDTFPDLSPALVSQAVYIAGNSLLMCYLDRVSFRPTCQGEWSKRGRFMLLFCLSFHSVYWASEVGLPLSQ